MKKLVKKIVKNEDGAVLVLVALLMIALMGFTALVVDVGMVALTKTKLQNAADAAALAGASYLGESEDDAKDTALDYAHLNGMDPSSSDKITSETTYTAKTDSSEDIVTATTPYLDPATNKNDHTKIEVVCTRTVPYTFAQVLGLTSTDVSARAVAQNKAQWDGESLPFVNMEGTINPGSNIDVWTKVDAGLFESILKYEVTFTSGSFKIDYYDGIKAKEGKLAEGTDNIKTNLADMWAAYQANPATEKYVYLFSLSDQVFSQHYVETDNGRRSFEEIYKNNPYPKIGVADNILLSQIILLECTWTNYSEQDKKIDVNIHAKYDLGNTGAVDLPDFPTSQGSSAVGSRRLVE